MQFCLNLIDENKQTDMIRRQIPNFQPIWGRSTQETTIPSLSFLFRQKQLFGISRFRNCESSAVCCIPAVSQTTTSILIGEDTADASGFRIDVIEGSIAKAHNDDARDRSRPRTYQIVEHSYKRMCYWFIPRTKSANNKLVDFEWYELFCVHDSRI